MTTQLLGEVSQDRYETGGERESRTSFKHDDDYIRYNPRGFDGTRQHTTWPHVAPSGGRYNLYATRQSVRY
jgi:hypothetical protein